MKVSVVMSVYAESGKWLEQSIQSILDQTYTNFEFLIVLDNPGLADYQFNFIKSNFGDERISIICNERNIGLALSLNKAIGCIASEFVVRMDADDIALPQRIESLVEKWRVTSADVICSNYSYYDENNFGDLPVLPILNDDEITRKLVRSNNIHHPTVMYTRDIFQKVNGYNDYPCAQDKDLWLRMAICGARFAVVNEILLLYRIHAHSISQSKKLLQQITMDYIKIDLVYRCLTKNGQFDKNEYNKFCVKRGAFSEKNKEKLAKSRMLMSERKSGDINSVESMILILQIFCGNTIIRRSLWIDFITVLVFRFYSHFNKRNK